MTIDEDVCTCDDRSYDRCGWCRRRPIEVSSATGKAAEPRTSAVQPEGDYVYVRSEEWDATAAQLAKQALSIADLKATLNKGADSRVNASDEERARTWTRAIWEDPDDEYAKVKRLIGDVRRETVEACAKAIDDCAADCLANEERYKNAPMDAFEWSVRVREARICAIRVRDLATPCASPANFTNDSEHFEGLKR